MTRALAPALFLLFYLAPSLEAAPGLVFLRLGSGARFAALGEAATALADVEALSTNPAALRAPGQRSYAFTHGAWIQDIRHDYLSLVHTRGQSTWGLSAQIAQADDLERRIGPSSEPLGRFGVYEGAAGLSYARRAGSLRWGLQLKALRQSISTRAASGAALDLGLLVEARPGLDLGLSLRNVGGMSKLGRDSTQLPLQVRAGLAWVPAAPLLVVLDLERARGAGNVLHAGAEYALSRLRLRAGYQSADHRGLSAGLGVQAGPWGVDYAFVPFSAGLGTAHRLAVQLHR